MAQVPAERAGHDDKPSTVERLRREGRVTVAVGDLLELGPPLAPVAGQPLPSEVLRDLRDHDR
jgi:hypothetical protein